MAVVTMRQLLESGVHFGHQTRRWNPKMKRFIMTERNGIYIIDLQQSVTYINNAYEFVKETVAHGGTILFVGTKRQAQEPIAEQATRVGMPYVNHRWLGGMLTNFQTISKRLTRLKELEELDFDDVAGSGYTKKELLIFKRERDKLERTLGGIRTMGRVPSAVWIVDTKKEHLAVDEARKLGLPVIAILDTNCDPDEVDYKIPGNDDAIRSVTLLTRVIADAVAEGLMARAGGPAAGDDVAADEPLADWERELLGGDAAQTAEQVVPDAGETAAAAAPDAAPVEVVETPAPEVAEALAEDAPAAEETEGPATDAPVDEAPAAEVAEVVDAPVEEALEAPVAEVLDAPVVEAVEAEVADARPGRAGSRRAGLRPTLAPVRPVHERAMTPMANYTAADIKALREKTAAGMMDVKKALDEADGDMSKAEEILRVKGLKGVTKREGRTASNGLVTARATDGEGTLVEVLCETDFVAKGERFISLADQVLTQAVGTRAADADALVDSTLPDGQSVKQLLDDANATIGEKIEVKRVARLEGEHVVSYLHKTSPDLPAQIGVLVATAGGDESVARDVAMHIAAFSPTVLTRAEVDEATVEHERKVAEATAKEEGKPEAALARIVEGRVNGYFKENVLLEQPFAKEPKKTVAKVLEEAGADVKGFVRFRVGS